jgi:hypothetical protein
VTAARERRLREAGLIEVLPGVGASGRLCLCTRQGLRAVGRTELRTPTYSLGTLIHDAVAARIGAQLELAGRRVLSEREIIADERATGERRLSAPLGAERFHRPDLVLAGDPPAAIEVELTDKAALRLDRILRAWRHAMALRRIGAVHYLCSPRALPYVRRAVQRIRAEEVISVEALAHQDRRLALPADSPLLNRERSMRSEHRFPRPVSGGPTSLSLDSPPSYAISPEPGQKT